MVNQRSALERNLSRLRIVHGYAGKMGVAALIGVVGGLTAIVFHWSLEEALHFTSSLGSGWWRLFLPALGGLICGLLVYPWAPEAAGQGVDNLIHSFHNRSGGTRKRIAPIKFFASIVTISSGGSAGYEGPVSQIGGALSSMVSSLFNMPRAVRRNLMLAGTAAGLGAVFKAPLGGALTSVEMLYKEDFESEALITSIVASVVAFAVFTAWAGTAPAFGSGVPDFHFLSWKEMLAVVLLGLICVPFSRLFVRGYLGLDTWFTKLAIPRPLKPALGGLAVGVIWLFYPEVAGGGMEFVGDAMRGTVAGSAAWLPVLFAGILLAKIVATSLTVGSGGAGGLFGPSLFMGGMVGAIVGSALEWLAPTWVDQPGALVLVGMGAFFAGAAKAPIAGVVMVCEMTGSYNLLPGLLVASVIHVVLTQGISVYCSQVHNKFASPVHRAELDVDILKAVPVVEAMQPLKARIIHTGQSIAELRDVLADTSVSLWPVFQEDRYVGALDSAAVLRSLLREPSMADHLLVADFLQKAPLVSLHSDLHSVSRLQLRYGVPQLFVGQHGKLVGVISHSDVVAAYDKCVAK